MLFFLIFLFFKKNRKNRKNRKIYIRKFSKSERNAQAFLALEKRKNKDKQGLKNREIRFGLNAVRSNDPNSNK